MTRGMAGPASAEGGEASGGEVTIYSSLPLQGSSRPTGIAIQNGIELALEQAGNEAGGVTINFEPLDDSTAQAGAWTPEAESANAKRAAQDDSAVAYLGTFNSGAAAISIPILNEASLAMLSPGNTAVGLTSDEPGADTEIGEPEIYYPTGARNYARIVPKDTVQGAALATADGRGRLHLGRHPARQRGLRRGPRDQRRACRRGLRLRADQRRRHRHQGGQLPGRGRGPGRARESTASSSVGSPPATRSSCTRTSPRRFPT